MTRGKATPRPAPEINRGAFPLLATFLRGYLHEDWQLDYETPAEARDAFLADASPEERRAFALECEIFLARTAALSLGEVRRVLAEALGSAWHPATLDEVRGLLGAGRRRRPRRSAE